MSIVRFIADLHFGHENMAKKRGFISAHEHDEFIISQWNKVVNKKDTTYIIGDITMEKSTNYAILDRLNGIKRVVLGNHDMQQHVPKLLNHVISVAGMIKKKFNEQRITVFLTHCPIHPMELTRVKYNIHGHIHDLNVLKEHSPGNPFCQKDDRYINVSCEQINYQPKTINELLNNINI